jgi:hypothetical protein
MRRLAVLVAAAALFAGCGDEEHSGALAWSGEATVFAHPTLPDDRMLTGRVRNQGLRRVRVDVADVRMLAADGSRVPATPVFLQTFGKSLWSPGRGPEQMPDTELRRTGRIAFLKPGEEVPLTVAWHAADGAPVRVEWGGGSLRVPG